MYVILWLIAIALIVVGIVKLTERQYLLGAVLIIVGFLVGPGGVSVFS